MTDIFKLNDLLSYALALVVLFVVGELIIAVMVW
jgi:hypothetical protein